MRLIDAEALDEKGIEMPDTCVYVPIETIWNAPTITPDSLVRHTKWVMIPVNGVAKFRCGNINCCGLIPQGCSPNDLAYCPHCGAKMDLDGSVN